MKLRLHAFEAASRANGPGVRAVLWTQGCSLGCVGCFNPETHDGGGGEELDVEALVGRVRRLAGGIAGVTVSGGEPLQQARPVMEFLRRVRAETGLSALLFTGFTWDEVARMPEAAGIAGCVDVLIAGRFEAARRRATGLCGSANKEVRFFSARYGPADLAGVPVAEAWIEAGGEVRVSGIDPPALRDRRA
ncbi:MAG: radical SAM protein [Planctomycetes bacterium]|nr:radical SAM protein [Planctomycetota bacterium]